MRALPRSLPLLLAVLLAACGGDADFSDSMPQPVTLDAEEFRDAIMKTDRLVFDSAPMTGERREQLAYEVEQLATRAWSKSHAKFMLVETLELRRFAAGSRSRPLDAPRAPMQNEWMRLRSNLFDDQPWFARSAADLGSPTRKRVTETQP